MSYVLTPILVDISKLQTAIGSRDTALIDGVMAVNPEEFEDEGDEEQDDEIPLRVALRHLIMGDEVNTRCAHQYGYALEKLCDYLGEVLLPDVWGGVRWEAVEACGLQGVLGTGPPVKLPPIADFPKIGHIPRTNIDGHIRLAKERLGTVRDEELKELLDEYLEWLHSAQAKGTDVIFFYR